MRSFHSALNATVTGVTVVTTRVGGRPHGQTVTTLSSISDEPPQLLVAVSPELAAAIVERGAFAANVLGDDQARVAEAFRACDPEFLTRDWWPFGGGLPRLNGAAAWFECSLARVVPAGERVLVMGDVIRAARGSARPLAYVRRGYAAPLAA
ncbi:flavin reductase [Solirubrobacter sp. CPCC 204708]|uniref:Flavin reductase family protein n=1 Tax=Solirubrobacter deserti TaxID=2282478 RepID=A0ABT4RMJ2_9ACTN|nr:flavin reductase family protein [Solirubrobacter deserti]MBE2316933.1 flavin reductase [Solirubrobacter deserti]MDA0139764.1 flavin reductase family protein [Solirubrobacter deserti]